MQETKFTPPVIEPSFGIGRVLYSFLEHSFDIRNKDKQRAYLKFKQWIAPTKVALLPLSKNAAFDFLVQEANSDFMEISVSSRIDESGADELGKRYAQPSSKIYLDEYSAVLSPENEDGLAASSREDQSAASDARRMSETPDDQDASETPCGMTDNRPRL